MERKSQVSQLFYEVPAVAVFIIAPEAAEIVRLVSDTAPRSDEYDKSIALKSS